MTGAAALATANSRASVWRGPISVTHRRADCSPAEPRYLVGRRSGKTVGARVPNLVVARPWRWWCRSKRGSQPAERGKTPDRPSGRQATMTDDHIPTHAWNPDLHRRRFLQSGTAVTAAA